ncbi:MAG TPA: Crp/Fnr family transcriptional regulator [Actinomycetota bacterium]|nr:Crp/Fnr family transcriptional regulator [Actinomycetota bacterium]
MDQHQIVGVLASNPMFDRLSRYELTKLSEDFSERRYAKGDPVFIQGAPGDALFVLVEGSLKVVLTSEDGEEMVLVTLRPPGSVGELALADGGPRSASVIALEDSHMLVLPRSRWIQRMGEHAALRQALLEVLATTLRRLTDQAADFVFLDLQGRVAKLLISLAEAGESESLDLKMTQTDIAHMVGGSRQSVNQILRGFQHRGDLEVDGGSLVIKNLERLRRLAHV